MIVRDIYKNKLIEFLHSKDVTIEVMFNWEKEGENVSTFYKDIYSYLNNTTNFLWTNYKDFNWKIAETILNKEITGFDIDNERCLFFIEVSDDELN